MTSNEQCNDWAPNVQCPRGKLFKYHWTHGTYVKLVTKVLYIYEVWLKENWNVERRLKVTKAGVFYRELFSYLF